MSEGTHEQLKPSSQETIDAIWNRVADLAEGGFQDKNHQFRVKTLREDDEYVVNIAIASEMEEELHPSQPLVTIGIDNPRIKGEEPLSYSLYKDMHSGKTRLEKNIPSPKKKMLSGDEPPEEKRVRFRQVQDEQKSTAEDITIRRCRGLSAVGEPEAQKLLQRLNALNAGR